MNIPSPVTGQHSTEKELDIDTSLINNLYAKLGIDTTRFFTNINSIELRRCSATGYRFYYPYTIFGDDKFYEELQTKLNWYYMENRWEHSYALRLLSGKQKVLEVGSGSGHFLDMLKKQGIEAEGLELNPKAVKEASSRGLNIYNVPLQHFSSNHTPEYDAVCSFQVLEHIYDVKSYIEHCLKVLKPGGKLIIAVPNNNPYIYRYDVYHTLNLPPHHSGLWNRAAFMALENHFPIRLKSVQVEPLREYKEWYRVQQSHYKKNSRFIGLLTSVVPRPVYKLFLKLFRNKIEGRNIIAVFTKL